MTPKGKAKLAEIQHEAVVKKGRINAFAKFKYRSAEDILEAMKDVLYKHRCSITLDDAREATPDGAVTCKVTATLWDEDGGEIHSTHSFADIDKGNKAQSAPQACGGSISYARKYALCGLLAIGTGEQDVDSFTPPVASPERRQDAASPMRQDANAQQWDNNKVMYMQQLAFATSRAQVNALYAQYNAQSDPEMIAAAKARCNQLGV